MSTHEESQTSHPETARETRRRGPSQLYVRDSGEGVAVLLLHAFPLNSRMWEPQIEELRRDYRVLAPDLPGFGLSPDVAGTPSLADYARDIVAALDSLHVDRVVVAGLSMGGYIAFRMLEELGPRLIGLVLADTRASADPAEAVAGRHALAAEIEANGVDVAVNEMLPKLLGATSMRLRPEVAEAVRSIARENAPGAVAATLRAMAARPDSQPLLRRIACPTLVIVGEEDEITPPDGAAVMAETIPGARLAKIRAAGHLSNLETPAEFNDALRSLLAEASPVA